LGTMCGPSLCGWLKRKRRSYIRWSFLSSCGTQVPREAFCLRA